MFSRNHHELEVAKKYKYAAIGIFNKFPQDYIFFSKPIFSLLNHWIDATIPRLFDLYLVLMKYCVIDLYRSVL